MPAQIGDNNGPVFDDEVGPSAVSSKRLQSFVERIESLMEEKQGLQDDIKDIFTEAKGTGFDVKIMRQVIRLRKMAAEDRREQEELIDTYMRALGMTE